MRRLLISFIKCYQWMISPLMANHCRFHTSCSCYAIQAIDNHGAIKGCYLALRRLLRCHPFHPGGYDPVPEKHSKHDGHTTH
jgi:hypothetical protein